MNDPATGEKFHIEAEAGFWTPTADITFASAGFGIPGDSINVKRDLGVTDQGFPALQPATAPRAQPPLPLPVHPDQYSGSTRLDARHRVQRHPLLASNVPVNSSLDWKAYRFGYQYDFIVKNRGFGGFILEAKYTDVQGAAGDAALAGVHARSARRFRRIGGIGRVYVVPEHLDHRRADRLHASRTASRATTTRTTWISIIYGTVNFTNNIGVKGGYRSLDLGYIIKDDTGSFTLKGIYFGAVLRY